MTLFEVPSEYPFKLAGSLSDTLENIPPGTTSNASLAQLRRTFSEIGGFPEIVAEHFSQDTSEQKNDERVSERMRSQKMSAQRMQQSEIVGRVLRRDIPEVARIRNPRKLEKLLYTVANLASKQVSPTNLSRKLGISKPTVDTYLSHLETAFLIFQIPNYPGSEGAVQKRGRKLYFMDWAVRNAVLQYNLPPDLGETDEGYLLENLAASALRSLAVNSGTRLCFWRNAEDTEVDLIYDHPRKPLAFEIGRSHKHSLKGLHELAQKHPEFRHRCYFVSPTSWFLSSSASPNGVGTIPLDQFLMAVGAQTRQEIVQSLSSFS